MSSRKPSKLVEAHSDSVLEKKEKSGGGASEYYDFMLREAKLKKLADAGDDFLTADVIKKLGGVSDLEKLEFKVLARLSEFGDDDPYLLNYFSITKTSNRTDCAKKIARKSYRKQLMETAITQLAPSSDASSLQEKSKGKGAEIYINGFGF